LIRRRPSLLPSAALAVLCWCSLLPGSASAGRQGEAPLRPLELSQVPALASLLAEGDLVVLESDPQGRLQQIDVLARVEAPAAAVMEILSRPEDFPKLVPSMIRGEILRQEGTVKDVGWELEIPFKNPEGVNRFHDERPNQVRYYPTSGTVPWAAWRWQAVPLGPSACIVVHQTTADVREVSWVVAQFLDAWPTFEHGAVASTAIVFVRAVVAEAEARQRGAAAQRPLYAPGRRSRLRSLVSGGRHLDLKPLAPLLDRGLVALVELGERGQLEQTTIVARLDAAPERLMPTLSDVSQLASFVPSIAATQILSQKAGRTDYYQWLEMPLVKLKMHVQMNTAPRRIAIRALPDGALPSSLSGWELLPGPTAQSSLGLYYLHFDAGEIGWFVKKLLQREPYFQPGLNLATGLVLVRAVQERAHALSTKP